MSQHRSPLLRLSAALSAALLGLGLASPAVAEVIVSDPWARASAGMARAGAAFMSIENTGSDDRLVAAHADVSEVVELHTHIKDGDVMRMRKVEAIALPGGQTTALEPGGLHVMFINLTDPLTEGETFPLTLVFEEAGQQTVTVQVRGVGAMGPGTGH